MATAKKPSQWDVAVFEKMSAPIRLRIERKNPRTGQMEPIPLPQDVWSKEDAERIEQIILNDVAGGGSYKGQMIDSNGTSMEWTFAFPTDYFPPLIPPGSAAALGQSAPAPAVAGTPAAIPSWQRGAFGMPVSPPGQPFVPSYTGAPQMQQPPFGFYNPYPYQPPPPTTSTPLRRDDERTEQLRQQLDAMRQSAAEERHAREREAAEARHREQVAAMQGKFADEMRQMREMMAEHKRTRPEDDPAILAMKQQNELLQRQMDEQRRQLEQQQAEARHREAEARHREEMRQLQDNSQRQIDALKELIAKASENRQDPQLLMLIEMQRQQSEAAREQARIQSEIQREATRAAAESPRQMVDMMERLRSAGGLEQTLSAINTSYTGLMDQQRSVLEMVMNMGPDPKMALAEGALAGVKEVAERFVVGKRDEAIARERTEQMKAQERATQAQAQAMAAQAYASAPYRYEDGSIKGQPPQREQLAGQQEEAPEVKPKNGKPSEQEFFGPLMEHVTMLRDAARKDEVDPDTLATFVIQAAMAVEQSGEVVPVYVLYHEERYAELVDLLLPGASSEFIGACVRALEEKINALGVGQQSALIDDEPDDPRAQA